MGEKKSGSLGKIGGGLLGVKCPKCGSTNIEKIRPKQGATMKIEGEIGNCKCKDCGCSWPCLTAMACYITTATCVALGKGDDCYELNLFRRFRDDWLSKQPDGMKLIEEYYSTAPRIVETINRQKNAERIYISLWNSYLASCLKYLESGNFKKVKEIYVTMVNDLKKKFL